MQNLKILNSRDKKSIFALLEKQFGYGHDLDYEFFMNLKNRIFILNKDVKNIDMDELRINSLGLYFGEINKGELRLSIEGSEMIGEKADRNILELSDEDAERWMKGEDFEVDTALKGFVIIKNGDDFLGCGRVIGKRLLNYVPKERRV